MRLEGGFVESLLAYRLPIRHHQRRDVRPALPHHDRPVDEGIAHELELQRLRCDVLAHRGLEERLLAIRNLQEAIGVDLADVAGVDPPVPQRLGRLRRFLVVPQHVARALDEDLAVVGNLHLDARERLADCEEAVRGERVGGRPRRHLGHAPAIEDGHADRPEELLDLPRQGRPAADEEPQSASGQAVAERREHQAVGDAVLRAQQGPLLRRMAEGRADTDRPVEESSAVRG